MLSCKCTQTPHQSHCSSLHDENTPYELSIVHRYVLTPGVLSVVWSIVEVKVCPYVHVSTLPGSSQTGSSVGGTVRDLDGLRESEQMCVFLVMWLMTLRYTLALVCPYMTCLLIRRVTTLPCPTRLYNRETVRPLEHLAKFSPSRSQRLSHTASDSLVCICNVYHFSYIVSSRARCESVLSLVFVSGWEKFAQFGEDNYLCASLVH